MTDAKVAADKVIEVAVGVIYGESRATVLLSSRPKGKVYAGWWEFPGGKLEAGETPAQALARELREELAIEARDIRPWFVMEHVYPHGHVRVHFMRVFAFDTAAGIEALEGQRFAWVDFKGLEAYERLLPMVEIVVRRAFLPDVLLLAGDTVRDWKKALAFALPQSAAVAGLSKPAASLAVELALTRIADAGVAITGPEEARLALSQEVLFGLVRPECVDALQHPRLPCYVVVEADKAQDYVQRIEKLQRSGLQGVAVQF